MTEKTIIDHLESNKEVIVGLLNDFSGDEFNWKQEDEKWCALEIVCHLVDEEKEDFRTRVRVTLETPGVTPPKIDPVAWVLGRKYMEQEFPNKIKEFHRERTESIKWLRELKNPIWDNYFEHPTLGKCSSFFYLKNWLAHDYLHTRQITRLKYDLLENSDNTSIEYAGNWVL